MNFYILAGGGSTRMGKNKALLKLGGRTVVETVISAIPAAERSIKIVTNFPIEFEFLHLRLIQDVHPGIGPLGGIHAGLVDSSSQYSFFLACDLPFITEQTIRLLLEAHDGHDITVSKSQQGVEPLCGIYSRDCLTTIERQVSRKQYSLRSLLQNIPAKIVEADQTNSLFNMNSQEDYRFILKRLKMNEEEQKRNLALD